MTEKMRQLRDTFTKSYTEGLKDVAEKEAISNDEGFKTLIEELALLISKYKPSEHKRLETISYVNNFFSRTVYLYDGSIAKDSKEPDKDIYLKIVEIAKRAEEMDLLIFDRMSLIMDLDCANDEFNLRLDELLSADNFNFSHDIVGIQNHLDRKAKKMGDFFVPRYAGFINKSKGEEEQI